MNALDQKALYHVWNELLLAQDALFDALGELGAKYGRAVALREFGRLLAGQTYAWPGKEQDYAGQDRAGDHYEARHGSG